MEGDNSIYGRYGSFPGRSTFLDSIPPFPWMRSENITSHYPAPVDDPRLKQASHFEDPRMKTPHVMEDPRLRLTPHMDSPHLKSPVIMDDPRLKPIPLVDDPRFKPPANTYPLFLDDTGVAPQTSRYYNKIQMQNEDIYSSSYDNHSQSPIVHYSPKDPTSQYREPYKDPTMSRQSVYYTEHSKEPNLLYDNHCQYSTAKTTTTSDPALELYQENLRKGSLIGPFALGYAAPPYQTIIPNHGNNAESCPEEVIEKALVNRPLEQSNAALEESKPRNVENNNGKQILENNSSENNEMNIAATDAAVNLTKDVEGAAEIDKQAASPNTVSEKHMSNEDDDDKTDSYDGSDKSEPDETNMEDGMEEEDKSSETLETKTRKYDQEKVDNGKVSKCIETQTAFDLKKTKRKDNPAIDSKSLASILGKLSAKVRKVDKNKSNKESKNDKQKKNYVNPPTQVIKIIKCFKDKNGKFTPKENNCRVIIQKVNSVSGSIVHKEKSINDKKKVIIKKIKGGSKIGSTVKKSKSSNRKNETKKAVRVSKRQKARNHTKKASDTEDDINEEANEDSDKDDIDTKPFAQPKVIIVQPTPPTKSAKLLSEEDPIAYIDDNDSYSNATMLSLATLPRELFLGASGNSEHGIGVFCKKDIQRGTQLGPVRGEKIMFQDISPAADFTHIWCFSKNDDWQDIELIDTSNENHSNWCRYIRCSLNSNCNLIRLKKDNHLYFMSSRTIKAGEELVYYLRYFGGDSTGPHHSASFPEKLNEDESSSHCAHCKISLSNAVNYIKHCQIYHTTGSGKTRSHCRLCNAVFLSRRELKKHSKQFHSGHGGEFICAVCGKTYVYQTDLKEHMKLSHYEEPTECGECGKILLNPKKLQAHKQRAHSRQTFSCEKCGKIFTQNSVLQRHKMIHDEVYSVACDRCGKLFRDKHNLKVHLLTHSGVKPFECSIQGCTAAFTVKQCLQGHYRKVHGYTDLNMPPITRSVPFTPDAYMGQQDDMATKLSFRALEILQQNHLSTDK